MSRTTSRFRTLPPVLRTLHTVLHYLNPDHIRLLASQFHTLQSMLHYFNSDHIRISVSRSRRMEHMDHQCHQCQATYPPDNSLLRGRTTTACTLGMCQDTISIRSFTLYGIAIRILNHTTKVNTNLHIKFKQEVATRQEDIRGEQCKAAIQVDSEGVFQVVMQAIMQVHSKAVRVADTEEVTQLVILVDIEEGAGEVDSR